MKTSNLQKFIILTFKIFFHVLKQFSMDSNLLSTELKSSKKQFLVIETSKNSTFTVLGDTISYNDGTFTIVSDKKLVFVGHSNNFAVLDKDCLVEWKVQK